MKVVNIDAIISQTAPDGARVREIAGRSTGLTSHSLAIIQHPAGTSSTLHHHTSIEEIYFVSAGKGRLQVDGEDGTVSAGDAIVIRPGERHKLWNDGPGDLELIVTCAPAYTIDDVVWDE